MKFRFPKTASVPDPAEGSPPGARVKVRDAILAAAGKGVHCQESRRGHKCVIQVHLEPDSAEEICFKLALPSGIHPEYEC
jgi:hypothetical protein